MAKVCCESWTVGTVCHLTLVPGKPCTVCTVQMIHSMQTHPGLQLAAVDPGPAPALGLDAGAQDGVGLGHWATLPAFGSQIRAAPLLWPLCLKADLLSP